MNQLDNSSFPTFDEFYEQIHGYAPFPWQSRLAKGVATEQWQPEIGWPQDIGVPTGCGKTACIDIAVWNLARDIHENGGQRTAPTRIWYVVNRRLLVDAAYTHALELQEALQTALVNQSQTAVGQVAKALDSGCAVKWSTGPLHVARLRGGVDRGYRPPDPATPSLMLATVPMLGSRLLFSGYGSSPSMRPIDAALAGTDSLVLLDEAHLARPLQETLKEVKELPEAKEQLLPGKRCECTLINLTATGASDDQVFALDEQDSAHPLIQQRVSAAKPTELISCADKHVPQTLAETAIAKLEALTEHVENPAICVFVNTAKRAPDVFNRVKREFRKAKIQADVRLLTGRLRSHDAKTVVAELTSGGSLAVNSSRKDDSHRTKPLVVVATQTLEVGADLDFDALISESAGVRSLVQRFGRLNRLGKRSWALGAIIHADDLDKKGWPVYGEEPKTVWQNLEQALGFSSFDSEEGAPSSVVELGPGVISEILGEPQDPAPLRAQLLPNHIRTWAKTSQKDRSYFAPVEPFISGQDEEQRRISIIWRSALPLVDKPSGQGDKTTDKSKTENKDSDSSKTFRLLPAVHGDESVEISLYEFQAVAKKADLETVWVLQDKDETIKVQSVARLAPGSVVVLESSDKFYSAESGWDPKAKEDVQDVAFASRCEAVLSGKELERLRAVGIELIDLEKAKELFASEDGEAAFEKACDLADLAQRYWSDKTWVSGISDERVETDGPDARRVLESILINGAKVLRRRESAATIIWKNEEGTRPAPPLVDAAEELSTNVDIPIERAVLSVHLANVGDIAQSVAKRLGLSPEVCQTIGDAGRLHDVGKADPRFQILLGAEPTQAMAKSLPGSSGSNEFWPKGTRHEAVSVMLFQQWLKSNDYDETELATHLVASHHGYGRPLLPAPADGKSIKVKTPVFGSEVEEKVDLSYRDWEQPKRFAELNKRFGPWGLALLEAVLRQADHAESSASSNGITTWGEKQ